MEYDEREDVKQIIDAFCADRLVLGEGDTLLNDMVSEGPDDDVVRDYEINRYTYLMGELYAKKNQCSYERKKNGKSESNIFKDAVYYILCYGLQLRLDIDNNKEICEEDFAVLLRNYSFSIEYCFDRLINSFFFKQSWSDILSLPKELSKLVMEVMDLKEKDKVYNPFSEVASFSNYAPLVQFYNIFPDKYLWAIDKILVDSKGENAYRKNITPFNKYDIPDYIDIKAYTKMMKQVQKGVTFEQIFDASSDNAEDYKMWNLCQATDNIVCFPSIIDKDFPLYDIVETLYYILKDGGKMAIVLPVTFLSSEESFQVRKKIIDEESLFGIYTLPNKIFPKTNATYVVLYIIKKKSKRVLMFDASNLYIEENSNRKFDLVNFNRCLKEKGNPNISYVSYNRIKRTDYNLNLCFYKDFHIINDEFPICSFGSIVKTISTPSKQPVSNGHYVKLEDLYNSVDDYSEKEINDFPEIKIENEHIWICDNVLLIPKQGKVTLTYINYEINPQFLYASSDIIAYKFDEEKVYIPYVVSQLRKYLANFHKYNIQVIPPKVIRSWKINLPKSLEVQKLLYEEYCNNLAFSLAAKAGISDAIQKVKNDYVQSVRSRKHNMKTFVSQMYSFRTLMTNKLREASSLENFKPEAERLMATFSHALERLDNILETFSREDKFGVPEKINLDKFLSEHYTGRDNYVVEYIRDDSSLEEVGINVPKKDINLKQNDKRHFAEAYVFIGMDDILSVFDNIVMNAVRHGFVDNKQEYLIKFYLTIEPDNKMFKIDVSNNGLPFPKGMTKERYGILGEKAGKSGNTGVGGYIVRTVLEHYQGDFEINTKETPTGIWNTVSVYLPIYKG